MILHFAWAIFKDLHFWNKTDKIYFLSHIAFKASVLRPQNAVQDIIILVDGLAGTIIDPLTY